MFAATAGPLQNGTQYNIVLESDDGTRLKVLDMVGPFYYTKVINGYGYFSLELPQSFDQTLLNYDCRVLFWRRPVGGAMYLDFEGLIRYRDRPTDEFGNLKRIIQGPSLEYLLDGRVVAYVSGSAQADQTDQADDMLALLAQQNIGSSAIAARQISSTYLSAPTGGGLGPSLTKGMSYRSVLAAMQEICQTARTAGTEVYFAMVPTGETTFEFRTYIGQPGTDRRTTGPFFGLERGNMAKPRLTENAMQEINFAYALGQGQGSSRTIQTAEDTTRSGRSVFGRREGKINSSGNSSSAGVTADAQALLVAGRPINSFGANLLSIPGSVYGLDWNFGDRVSITFDGIQFNALVRAVTVKVDEQGMETLDPTVLEAYL